MKHAFNFRFDEKTVVALSVLQKKLHVSKTAVIEKAIHAYVKRELSSQQKLLVFAGILSSEDADAMMDVIKSEKHNKNMDFEL